ncbi:MAG: DMT family transporter [Clostridia bacterium]|nr:DMT family transporter [Clostridia bacterium]
MSAKGRITISRQFKGSLYLTLCSFVWGMAFVAQGSAMAHVGPATFVCVRFAITFIVLMAAAPLIERMIRYDRSGDLPSKQHVIVGAILGTVLGVASMLQQLGLVHTSPTNSGFVTALYILIVPIIGLFLGQRVRRIVWFSVLVSLVGLYLLCVNDRFTVNPGDLITLGCALVFAVHITLVDRLAGELNTIRLSAIQFGFGSLSAGIVMLLTETPSLSGLKACLPSLLYAALFSGAMGYTLQLFGQKYTSPALASLIMCLESVFAALGEWLATRLGWFQGQSLDARRILGCVLMLAASMIAQLPDRRGRTD